ncbi:MAG: hypothetical protein IJH39_07325 [Clostridia bacterium]|nr:hypothetical protein [Clostridia bacterium]
MEKRYYDCVACTDKNCAICPACGNNPNMRDVTDSYRAGVNNQTRTPYYSRTVIPRYDPDGNFVGYAYNKNGE